MGIADLWPIVSTACDERIAFPVFLDNFISQHARPPRLAIDAYMFMFWSQLPEADDNPANHRRIIRNFMAKLWYLVRCNVLFVVVFDGKYKPGKLRHGHIPHVSGALSYDEAIRYFHSVSPTLYGEGLSLVEQIKDILTRNCIDFIQAPAEAEAECAWIQRIGVVDYVVSDDSDTLVFGATQMLRMFNRVKHYDSENKPVLSSTNYYVTPVYMDHVVKRTGLSTKRLVLVAVLRGGDYSSGVENIGITRAKEIALCGTTLLQDSPRKRTQDFGSLPDFSRMLYDALVLQEKTIPHTDPFRALKPELDRAEALVAFNNYLDDFLRTLAKDVFGRMATMKAKVHVDDYYALLYLFPLINRKIFKFTPYSVSFGQLQAPDADLAVTEDSRVKRFNLVCSHTTIGTLVISKGVQSFIGVGRAKSLKRMKFALPKERKISLKPFVTKLLAEEKYHHLIELTRTKPMDSTVMAVLKFNRQMLNEAVYFKSGRKLREKLNSDKVTITDSHQSDSDQFEEQLSDSGADYSEEKLLQVEVPLSALKLVAPAYVNAFENRKSPTKSPRKKLPNQKTTLDLIWPGMLPSKTCNPEPMITSNACVGEPLATSDEIPVSLQQSQPTALKFGKSQTLPPYDFDSPTRTLPKRPPRSNRSPATSPSKSRRKSNVLLPGQSKVTSFFQPRGLQNPFQESLFVVSDEESEDAPCQYMSMKNTLTNGPVFLRPASNKTPIYSRISSPELSPTKRQRNQRLSPNSSPIKLKPEPADSFPPV